jgi:hypothetical protein
MLSFDSFCELVWEELNPGMMKFNKPDWAVFGVPPYFVPEDRQTEP